MDSLREAALLIINHDAANGHGGQADQQFIDAAAALARAELEVPAGCTTSRSLPQDRVDDGG